MKLHHVGIVVPTIEASRLDIGGALNMRVASPEVVDPEQRCRLVLLANGGGAAIELIEPQGADSPAGRSAAAGGGIAHLCYETPQLDTELARMRKAGALVIQPPKPAVLFGGRRVAFVYLRSNVVVELVEAGA